MKDTLDAWIILIQGGLSFQCVLHRTGIQVSLCAGANTQSSETEREKLL